MRSLGKNPKISIIIAAYNYLDSLKLTLHSIARQSFNDFEVIIADDGSKQDVVEWLTEYKASDNGFDVKHIWQPDEGFRKCRLLNRALLKSRGEYIVFIDADCILSKDFIEVHWRMCERGRFLGGRRTMINEQLASKISHKTIDGGKFDGITLWGIFNAINGNIKYYEEGLRFFRIIRGETKFSLLGSNFSAYKDDLYEVNGFDEDYESRGGGEDTDIAYRLELNGCKMKSVRYLAIQHHQGHPRGEKKDQSADLFHIKKRKMMKVADPDPGNINSILSDR